MLRNRETTGARGTRGEDAAATYLEKRGLKIHERQYRTRWGEIDLIGTDKDGTWVFVEVKTREHISSLSAMEAITPAKQRKIVGAALSYLKKHRLKEQNVRFDVVVQEGSRVEWITGAFEPEIAYTY